MLDFYVRLRRGWGELGEVGGRNGGCDWMGFGADGWWSGDFQRGGMRCSFHLGLLLRNEMATLPECFEVLYTSNLEECMIR